jgi:putative transposase
MYLSLLKTDNGFEFAKEFDKYCQQNKIEHKWTYPNSPKINGVIERFNRSIQEEWLNMYHDEMIDIVLINQRIKQYLYFYHHDRIHKSLDDQTPTSVVGYNINYQQSSICI